MELSDWEQLSTHGDLRSVIDPLDKMGYKNMLIDRVQWQALSKALGHGGKVLDFGCGIGRFAKRISALGCQYTGIDYCAGMIQAAKKFNRKAILAFHHFEAHRLPFPDASFDTIIAVRVFMHLLKTQDGQNMIKELQRVLVPNGRLLLLEEASLSGRKSGQAMNVLTEEDYVREFSGAFTVKNKTKVRSSEFSKIGRRWTEWGDLPYPIFRLVLPVLTRFESRRVARASEDYFTQVTYYDFLMEFVLRKT